MDLRGKVAVVTGASAGLGLRLATDLARAGAIVVGTARRADRLEALAEDLRALSPGSRCRTCDLSETDTFVGLLEQIEAEDGQVDVLCNVAGMGGILRNEPPTDTALSAIMEVNFVAPFRGMLTVLPGMRERRDGAVVNVSSDDARAPGPGAADYAASKAALSAATESLAYDARRDGVKLHVLYPGWMPTEMGRQAVEEGGMRRPPRAVRRSVAEVSSLVVRRLYDPRMEINAARLPLIAPVFRSVAPRTYQRMRSNG